MAGAEANPQMAMGAMVEAVATDAPAGMVAAVATVVLMVVMRETVEMRAKLAMVLVKGARAGTVPRVRTAKTAKTDR